MSIFRRGPDGARKGVVWTVLAGLLPLFALIVPNELGRFTPGAFVRVPLEGLLAVGVVIAVPGRARKVAAVVIGVVLGLLAIVKVVDLGFFAVLGRPFDLVFDWPLLANANEFLTTSIGRAGAVLVAIAAALLAVAVLVLMTLSALRLTGLVVRHRRSTAGAAAVFGIAWITCFALGTPVAGVAAGRLAQVRTSLRDHDVFEREVASDGFRDTPNLLTGLRGKDVVLAFVESYGQDAIENPRFASQVGAVLDAGTRSLDAAGFGSRSAFLASPTAGGGSWLAHSTLLSGVWVDNEQRYSELLKTKRLTLTGAFKRSGWRTVAVMPGTTRAWPEGSFYGYDKLYDRWHLGYDGPRFNWGTPPDQFTLSAFQRDERAPGHAPVMAEIPLVTSHAPWAPLPPGLVDWKSVGDGRIFDPMPAAGDQPGEVWRTPGRVRTAYRRSIQYSLNALISYVRTYGGDDLVLVFLGDHQPAPIVTGTGASRNVPVTIVARDPAVLKQISGWGWQNGLKPGHDAPVWQMNAFRDRFLTAFGSAGGR